MARHPGVFEIAVRQFHRDRVSYHRLTSIRSIEKAELPSGAVQCSRQWPLPEVDDRAPQDAPSPIDAEPRTTVLVEEAQSVFTLMRIDSLLANAGDRARPEQAWDLGGSNAEKSANQPSVD